MALLYLVAHVLMTRMVLGRYIYAVGGNIEAARRSGINGARTLMCAYGIAGLCSGLAGVIQAGRLGAASPLVGADIPLNAAAAVLLGGTEQPGDWNLDPDPETARQILARCTAVEPRLAGAEVIGEVRRQVLSRQAAARLTGEDGKPQPWVQVARRPEDTPAVRRQLIDLLDDLFG